MARPKKLTNIKKPETPKKTCSCCNKPKPITEFFSSKSPLFATDGKLPMCKTCIQNLCVNEDTGEIDEDKLKRTLRILDKPYYKDYLSVSYAQYAKLHPNVADADIKKYGKQILGNYFKNTMLQQLSTKTYADSEKTNFVYTKKLKVRQDMADINERYAIGEGRKKKVFSEDQNFEVTKDMIDLFGDGYTPFEYKKMYEKYEKLKMNYSLQTNIHQEALVTYVRFKVREEIATSEGSIDEARKWYDAAKNAASDGRLTPKQMSASDLQQGMNSISELAKAVEQATDVIKILPSFKYKPNDSPDFIIYCYLNYERKLSGMPPVDYESVYEFYEKQKQDYIEQHGDPYKIFSNDPSTDNREIIKNFIEMPDDSESNEENDDGGDSE